MSGITYALIGIAMPASYRMELDSDLETQVFQLIEQLKQTTFEKSNPEFPGKSGSTLTGGPTATP